MTFTPDAQTARLMSTAIAALSMDGVEKANSGHPGMPMGMSDTATVLFTKHLKYDAADTTWPDRDRFVLSAGHGSMLLYSLLYLTGVEGMELEDLKNFRQMGSKTAGHPTRWSVAIRSAQLWHIGRRASSSAAHWGHKTEFHVSRDMLIEEGNPLMKRVLSSALAAMLVGVMAAPTTAQMIGLRNKFEAIQPNHTMDQIRDYLGDPGETSFRGNAVAWQYCQSGLNNHTFGTVWFVDGVVYAVTVGTEERRTLLCRNDFREPDWTIIP